MITLIQYFSGHAGHKSITEKHRKSASILLDRVNALLVEAIKDGVNLPVHPVTKTLVSTADGGWRPPESPVGAPGSSHKEGEGVDVADRNGELDDWLTDAILEKYSLYREHPAATPRWCHLTTRPPKSGKRSFYP